MLCLSKGGFGKVFLVRDNRDAKEYVLKEIDLSSVDEKGRNVTYKIISCLNGNNHSYDTINRMR
jgi:serine/threonine protein kinase